MTVALKNYEALLNSGKWNTMYPEKEKIVALTTVAKKVKDINFKL